jgi:hypothetical protein
MPDNTEVELMVVPAANLDEEDPDLLEAALDRADAAIARGERGRPASEVLERLRSRRRDEALSSAVPRRS